jgi:hypothetical protein
MSAEEEIAALRLTLNAYVRDIERARTMQEIVEGENTRLLQTISDLQANVEDMRQMWTRSRHYARLRQYRRRLTAAEDKLRKVQIIVDGVIGDSPNADLYIDILNDLAKVARS